MCTNKIHKLIRCLKLQCPDLCSLFSLTKFIVLFMQNTLKLKNLLFFPKQIDSKAKIIVFLSLKCYCKQKEAYIEKKKP